MGSRRGKNLLHLAGKRDLATARAICYLLLAWPAWYLLGWDHLREAVRMLRLDRIESARLTDRSFQLRDADAMMVWRATFLPQYEGTALPLCQRTRT